MTEHSFSSDYGARMMFRLLGPAWQIFSCTSDERYNHEILVEV
jgi:hypothetical protein